MKEDIEIPEATVITLRNFNQQIQILQGYIKIIGETLVNANNLKGNFQFNQDYSKIICIPLENVIKK